ncbi:hypothetical protein M422DRAFT_48017 [Sphaerobolus stellatus SS14]|uniref:Uncharacterized protein n=1 Tax=Sphaerobolus stellatus (strain SS14) TaxID=990650 RepID=A0A0C9VX85_SPHS4|nr:hypothetical protein M422DRAFT_48017 [Sphaerobolus stellatus SS14]
MSPGSDFLTMPDCGGYRETEPYIHYFFPKRLKPKAGGEFPIGGGSRINIREITYNGVLDAERKLVFVGTDDRIKYYYWIPVENCNDYSENGLLPTHTFRCSNLTRTMAILPGGRFIRAGNGSAGVWYLHSPPTHSGIEIIGEELDLNDFETWCDDPEAIDLSSGSNPDTMIAFTRYKIQACHLACPPGSL